MHRFFFFLLLLFLPSQLGVHFWPEWSFVLGRRLDYLSPTLYFTDILIALLLVSWKNISVPWKILIPVCIIAGINIVFSLRWQIALYGWIKALEYGLLILYIVKTKPSIDTMFKALSIAVLYSSLIAIVQFVLQHSVGGPLYWLGERTFTASTPGIAITNFQTNLFKLRAYGTFPHPNVLGGFLAVTLPVVIASIAKQSKDRLSRPGLSSGLAMTATGLGIVALFLTFSRSAWIVFLFGTAMLVIQKPLLRYVFMMVVLLILFTFHPLDESVVVRQQLNTSAIETWTRAPLFGVGLGNFLIALPSSLPSKFIYFLQPVHNIYLLLFSEIGILGALCMAYCFWCIKKYKLYDTRYALPLISLLLLGLVDHYPLSLQQGQLLFAVLIGLLFI